jgi:MYXO-CTERM domain-containing protein
MFRGRHGKFGDCRQSEISVRRSEATRNRMAAGWLGAALGSAREQGGKMRKLMLIAAAATLAVPVAATATTTTVNGTDPAYSTPVEDDDDGDNGLWGLLGLLGLAGLLGRKKNEPDIHVDARRDSTNR